MLTKNAIAPCKRLAALISVNGWGGRRDAVVLATKVYNPVDRKANLPEANSDRRSLSAYKIRKHCEGRLKRLQTDWIDLYQMHHIDRECPWDEIWQSLWFKIVSFFSK